MRSGCSRKRLNRSERDPVIVFDWGICWALVPASS
jgi:hypothetical protein